MSKSAPLLVACLALAATAPAQARDEGTRELSEKLSDPATQATAALALSALAGTLLSVDIAPFARTMDSLGGITGDEYSRDLPPDATLGDLAGPRAQELPRELARRTPQAMGALSGMIGSLEDMMPQLRAMGREFKQQMRRSLPRE